MSKAERVFKKQAAKPYMSETKQDLIAGGAAAFVGTGALYPMDTFTTGAQSKLTREMLKANKKVNIRHFLKNPKEIPKLYKGIGYKWSKTIPAMALTFATHGLTKRFLDKKYTSNKTYTKGVIIKSAKVKKIIDLTGKAAKIEVDPSKVKKIIPMDELANKIPKSLRKSKTKQLNEPIDINDFGNIKDSKAWQQASYRTKATVNDMLDNPQKFEKAWKRYKTKGKSEYNPFSGFSGFDGFDWSGFNSKRYSGFGSRRPFSGTDWSNIYASDYDDLAKIYGIAGAGTLGAVGIGAAGIKLQSKYKQRKAKK